MSTEELQAYLDLDRLCKRKRNQQARPSISGLWKSAFRDIQRFEVEAVRNVLWSWVRDAADSWTCGFYSWCCDPVPADHVRDDDVVVA
ncbi:unnamed protein product [Symbiodinium sp. CCMP2592]|nr:unnamed protein product [Symbiodinium sp. CCMP2592]CAE7361583.1 unnamed protein product [Symbiodinium sp. CCMP2592]